MAHEKSIISSYTSRTYLGTGTVLPFKQTPRYYTGYGEMSDTEELADLPSEMVYEAEDSPTVFRLPTLRLQPGQKARIKIIKESSYEPYTNDPSQKYRYSESLIKDFQHKLEENELLTQKAQYLEESQRTLLEEVNDLKYKLKTLKEGIFLEKSRKLKKTILNVYRLVIPFFFLCAVISGLSMITNHFLPYPIDRTLFWTSLASTLGFALDYFTKDRKYAR